MRRPVFRRQQLPRPVKRALRRVAPLVDRPVGAIYRARHPDGLPFPPFSVRAAMTPTFSASKYFAEGRSVADEIDHAFSEHGYPLGEATSILDFACGCGRVAMHLQPRYPQAAFHGCDVGDEAIAWAADNVTGVQFAVSGPRPPLPYPDGAFDRIFCFSLWTHLTETDQLMWTREIGRLLSPDGVAVITTHGEVIHSWMTSEDYVDGGGVAERLREAGSLAERDFIFVPYDRDSGAAFDYRGIAGDYGVSFQLPTYTVERWAPLVDVVGVQAGMISGHDAVVVRRRAEDASILTEDTCLSTTHTSSSRTAPAS